MSQSVFDLCLQNTSGSWSGEARTHGRWYHTVLSELLKPGCYLDLKKKPHRQLLLCTSSSDVWFFGIDTLSSAFPRVALLTGSAIALSMTVCFSWWGQIRYWLAAKSWCSSCQLLRTVIPHDDCWMLSLLQGWWQRPLFFFPSLFCVSSFSPLQLLPLRSGACNGIAFSYVTVRQVTSSTHRDSLKTACVCTH